MLLNGEGASVFLFFYVKMKVMRETEFWAFFGNFHAILLFSHTIFLRLIIEFYEKICQLLAFF